MQGSGVSAAEQLGLYLDGIATVVSGNTPPNQQGGLTSLQSGSMASFPVQKLASADKKAEDLDLNALSALNKWVDGLSQYGMGSAVASETESMGTMATGLPPQQLDAQSQYGLERSGVASGSFLLGVWAGIDGLSGLDSLPPKAQGAPASVRSAPTSDQKVATAEQLGLYLDGMSSAAAAVTSVFEGSGVISGYTTGYTSLAPGVERYDIEVVDAADVQGLDLDGLGSTILPNPPVPTTDTNRIQPPQSSASQKLTWEDERELLTAERELLAAVGDGAGDDASECYASSQSSVGTAGSTAASTAPISVALTGFNALLSIDEQNVMSTAFEAGELGINLDALDDGGGLEASASMRSGSSIAGGDLSRQAAAESALNAYMQRQPPELRSGSSIADSDLSRQAAVTAPESGLNTFMQRQPPENLEASHLSRAAEAALDCPDHPSIKILWK